MDNYLKINKETWNKKVEVHLKSDFYFVDEFIKGKNSLNPIELSILGNIQGKNILHLQCHFGQDSISLSRLGGKVIGVDLSDKAIEAAWDLARKTNNNTEFICSDIYELPEKLHQKFDIVYTSYGTIGWLPDLDCWAKVISHFLKPKGQFILIEFHPTIWMFDDDFTEIKYHYFNEKPIIENFTGTYADRNSTIETQTISWNHSLSEVLSSLLNNGLRLESFEELDYSPYRCFKHMVEVEPNKFRIKHLDNKVPMVYALSAIKQ